MISAPFSITRDGEVTDLVLRGIAHTPGVRGDVELVSVHLDAPGEPSYTGEPLSDAEHARAIEALYDASLQVEPGCRRCHKALAYPGATYCGAACCAAWESGDREPDQREALCDRADRAYDEWKERRLERDLGR